MAVSRNTSRDRDVTHKGGDGEPRSSDAALIELLRCEAGRGEAVLGVGAIASRLGVTATAVRQRLDRLMTAGIVARSTPAATGSRHRGRPSHVYSLTEKGRRTGGDNFRDLAIVLWKEIREIRDPSVRQGLIHRIGTAMAGLYRGQLSGDSPASRLERMAGLLRDRDISCRFEAADPAHGGLPVLTSHSCPYPDLAEQDRGICAAERAMLQDLVGSTVRLATCRLDGGACCEFTAGDPDLSRAGATGRGSSARASRAAADSSTPPPTAGP